MERTKNRKILLGMGTVLVLALLIIIVSQYVYFVRDSRDQEVASQLSEVYGQINNQFMEMANKNWNILMDGALAIELSKDEGKLGEYIGRLEKQWKFHRWMFLDTDGSYMDTNGKTGHLNMGSDADKLFKDGENIVVDGDLADSDSMLIYAVPTKEDTYNGFKFNAIALGYYKENMTNVLEDTSFGGQGFCYFMYTDGKMLLALHNTNAIRKNFFHVIEKVVFETSSYNEIKEDIQNGVEGTCRYHVEKRKYYLHYQPVGFQNWVMVGIVPQAEVGQHVNEIVERTTMLTFLCSILFLMVIVVFLYERNRAVIIQKDKELSYRDQIFEILSGNTTNIFMVVYPDTMEVEYVSSNIEYVIGISRKSVLEDHRIMAQTMEWKEPYSCYETLKKLSQGEMFSTQIKRRNVKTGEDLWFEDFIYYMKIGETYRYILVMIDHTKEYKNREEMQTALKIAKEANEAKSSFLSRMSHDIRTPINVIVGFLPLMKTDIKVPEKLLEYIQKIQMASQHLLGLINDILDMSKIESGEASLHLNEICMSEIIEGVDTMIRPQAEMKSQTFKVCADNIRNDNLEGDSGKVTQILMNILSNAVKYTPEGGEITFIVQQLPDLSRNIANFRFIIRDNGIGISEEYQKVIFEPFTREENNAGVNETGTGLGMAIVKNLLTLMGGVISLRSRLGEGSTFTVELGFRIHENERQSLEDAGNNPNKIFEASAENSDEKKDEICLEGLHVLAVEDYRLNAEILQGMLEMCGMTCDICENGLKAVQRMEEAGDGYYDLILMDVLMPVMNGYEATKAIRAGKYPGAKTIPIIAMSANAFAEDIQNGMDAGMDYYLTKPLDVEMLKMTLKKILKKRKKIQEKV